MGSTLIPWIFICFNFLAWHISGAPNAPNFVESKRTNEWRANSLSKYKLTREDPYHLDPNEFKRTKNNEQLRADEKIFKNEIRNPDELEMNEERLRKHFYNSRHRSKNDAIRDNEITETKKSFKWIPKADEIKYNIWKVLERNITKDKPKEYGDLDYKQPMKNERKSQPLIQPANNSTYIKGFDLPQVDDSSISRSNKIFSLQQNKRSFWLDILNASVNGTGSNGLKRFKRAAHNDKKKTKNKKNAKKDNKKPKKIPKSEWHKYIRGGKKEERARKTAKGEKKEKKSVKQIRQDTGKNNRKEARGDTKTVKNKRNKSVKKEDKKNKESEKRKWEKMLNKGQQGRSNAKGNSKKMARANTKKQAKKSPRNGKKRKRKVEDVKDEKEGKKRVQEDERKIDKNRTKPNQVLDKKNRTGKGDRSVATKKTAKKGNKVSQKKQKAAKNARKAPTSKKQERGKKKKEPQKRIIKKKNN